MDFIIRYAVFSFLTFSAGGIYTKQRKHEKLLLAVYFSVSALIFLI